MIVGYQPGGSIKDSRVVLKFTETLPNRFNVPEAVVYREDEDNSAIWLLVKPKFSVLPEDSPLLSKPTLPEITLTNEVGEDNLYEHADIIKIDDDNRSDGGGDGPSTGTVVL
jgi:hypothetical protein